MSSTSTSAAAPRRQSPRTASPGRITAIQWQMPAILVGALVLRLVLVPGAGIYHPDELFQYLEQAHRLVFGPGIVPWEYRYGMRSWLLPDIVAVWMAVGDRIAPASWLYILLPRAVVATLSLTVVWSAWRFGRRVSPRAGLLAAGTAAVWAESAYMAPHILSELVSVYLLLPAAVLLTEAERSRRQLALAGLLVGLSVIFRIQHLPAAGLLFCLAFWHRRSDVIAFLAGGAAALVISVIVDVAAGSIPFGWALEYVRQNLFLHRAAFYGTESAWAYIWGISETFGWWLAPMLPLAAIGARREATLLRIALVNLAVHMAIEHKEYRFVLLTTTIFMILAAVGTGVIVEIAARRWPRRHRLALWLALLGWGTASAWLAASGEPARYATRDRGGLALFTILKTDGAMCGLATQEMNFAAGGGYTYLHRAVPIFAYARSEATGLARDAAGFNRLIGPATIVPPKGFSRQTCRPAGGRLPPTCLFARPGGCAPIDSAAEINRTLKRVDL